MCFAFFQLAHWNAEIHRRITLCNQYEKLLEEYRQFLDTSQYKLNYSEIVAMNFINLKQQLEAHNVSILSS